MKKLYAFFAAALISVCAFASKEEVPSDEVLANYSEPGQVCVCIYVPNDLKCYDIVFTGTYNDWASEVASCKKFEAVENYDGWYVVAVDDDGRPEDPEKDPYANLQGKPVQLEAGGVFNWDYQIGAATWVRGGAQIVQGGIAGEIDIIEYGTDAPNVYIVDGWKKDPCSAVYNQYTIAVINDGCDGFAVPFVNGSFTNWKFQQMQVNDEKTMELGAGYYEYKFRAAVGAEFQIVSGLMDAQGNIVEQPAWADACYIQENIDGIWSRINGGANYALGTEAEIVFDIRREDLRWARCDGVAPEDIAVSLKAPAGAPEAIEIIGGFDGWTGQAMTLENGLWKATVSAKPNAVFKFRSGVGEDSDAKWKVQIQYYDEDLLTFVNFSDGNKDLVFEELWEGEEGARTVVLDFSDPEKYQWSAPESGVEDIVLTETAKKVMVDGVLYIVRDNKLFNIQGAQVR